MVLGTKIILFCVLVSYCIAMTPEQAKQIKTVHLSFSNHLDIGFTNMSRDVVDQYFSVYFPKAIDTAKRMRAKGGKFIYTTKSWLVQAYLQCDQRVWTKCPTPREKDEFIAAIRRGDISWHAFPFNGQAEFMDVPMFEFGLNMTHKLDMQFGLKKKDVMGQRDVPGLTRSVIPILNRYEIKGLTIGVNGASAPAAVPPVFEWVDIATRTKMVVIYHKGGYGGVELESLPFIEGFDQTVAYSYRGDNDGPHSEREVDRDIDALKKLFPNAKIEVSPFSAYVDELLRMQPRLPVVTEEIGDTWLYGVPSDPWRVAVWRTMLRERTKCLLAGECDMNDGRFFEFSFYLLKVAEHTWGLDVKMNLDFVNWSKKDFLAARNTAPYRRMELSWIDQRAYLDIAMRSLGNHPLFETIRRKIDRIRNVQKPELNGFTQVQLQRFSFQSWQFEFSNTGALSYLSYDGRVHASNTHKLGEFLYQTFDENDYKKFFNSYSYCPKCPWFPPDFGKPNMSLGNPVHSTTHANLEEIWTKSGESGIWYTLKLKIPENTTRLYGAPLTVWKEYFIPKSSGTPLNKIHLRVIIDTKTPSRLPESLWVSFNPIVADSKHWSMDKLGGLVNPFNIVKNGSLHQHGIHDFVINRDGNRYIRIETVDSAVVSPMTPIPFPSPLNHIEEKGGMHFNLFNNIWGTNYIMWYPYLPQNQNSLFDFIIEIKNE